MAARSSVTAALFTALALTVAVAVRGRTNREPGTKASPVASEAPSPISPVPPRPPALFPSSRPGRAAAPRDEASLMARLRSIKDSDPAGAVDLAREGNVRFPESADAPERASILIHALARQGRAAEARGEAESMVNHYPDSSWVREIEGFTGAHRHRNIRLRSDGALEYY